MVLKNVLPFRDHSNAAILNAIRNDASDAYQNRIPAATKASIAATADNILNYRPQYNEFVDALVNQIGRIIIRNLSWTNPLGKFKVGLLGFGDTIEEIGTGVLNAYVYDSSREPLEQAIFGQEIPEVQASFHKINRQNYYKITVNRAMLVRAFQSEDGLYTLINDLLAMPAKSDEYDEYLVMRQLFKEYDDNDGFFKIHIESVEQGDAADAKAALRKVRSMAGKLTFISRRYNAAGLPVAASPDQLELFATPDFMAGVDVEALAAAFNTEYTNIPMRITLIDDFNIPGVEAILSTSDFFIAADSLLETTTAENPVGLHTNYFLHHHGIYSFSRFVPAVAFTTGEGTMIEDDPTPVTGVEDIEIRNVLGETVSTVTRGQVYEVWSEAITDGPNDAVIYSVTGNDASFRTAMSQTGTLYVYPGEDSTTLDLHVEATDAEIGEFVKTRTVNVVGPKINLWPVGDISNDSDSDGLFETAVPEAPTFVDLGSTGTVTIPDYNYATDHYKYRKAGVDIAPGDTTISASTVFTAVAAPGWEFPTGATVSWTFAP